MNVFKLFSIMSFFLSCNAHDPKFIRKEIIANGIAVKWFFYSSITSFSPDIIEVSENRKIVEIFRAGDAITDVAVDSNVILVKLFEPYRGNVYTKPLPKRAFNHKIVFDTTATIEEYQHIPIGKKE